MSTNTTTYSTTNETAFEKKRGISRVEIRTGFAQAHVSQLADPVVETRLGVLGAIAEAGVTLDFLKLTQSGLSFLVREDQANDVSKALEGLGVHFSCRPNRHVMMVHAVNMRDEEGLIAHIVHEAIASGAKVDHISDMHDRLLMVVDAADSERVQRQIEKALQGA